MIMHDQVDTTGALTLTLSLLSLPAQRGRGPVRPGGGGHEARPADPRAAPMPVGREIL